MIPFGLRFLALVGIAFVLPLVSASAPAAAKSKYECFTDDGYGRMLPCSGRYKAEHRNWRQSNECFTDEGNGRYRPCDSQFRGGATTSRN